MSVLGSNLYGGMPVNFSFTNKFKTTPLNKIVSDIKLAQNRDQIHSALTAFNSIDNSEISKLPLKEISEIVVTVTQESNQSIRFLDNILFWRENPVNEQVITTSLEKLKNVLTKKMNQKNLWSIIKTKVLGTEDSDKIKITNDLEKIQNEMDVEGTAEIAEKVVILAKMAWLASDIINPAAGLLMTAVRSTILAILAEKLVNPENPE
tara:strand:- start:214 stop:834 length:621 start_codon:yes stop_codon:yes gene_type:complete